MRWKMNFDLFRERNQPDHNAEQKFEINEKNLHLLFDNCSDIQFQPIQFNDVDAILLFCKGMTDEKELGIKVLPEMRSFLSKNTEESLKEQHKLEQLQIKDLSIIHSKEKMIQLIFSGYGLFYFKKIGLLLSFEMSNKPKRAITETSMEVSMKGPRDNFIEDITTNMALIRKRLPTNSLRSEELTVGTRSKTAINIVYMDDIANKEVLEKVKNKIDQINVDAIYSGQQLIELMEKKSTLFPIYDYSARPDYLVKSLVTGRIILLIDGLPYAIIIPANFFLLIKSAEDSDFPFLYSSFERLIRLIGILLAALLPGFWISVTSFHPNQLPVTLLATIIESRKGIPLSAGLEALMMLVLFELFREAGLRLPAPIGQTLSVVGGLIIGDAAIRAGLTSPSMLVVIAASSVATYTLTNQALVGALTLVRFFILIISSFLGFFGFFLSLFFVLLWIANIRVFGIPYLVIGANINIMEILKSLVHLPASKEKQRMKILNPKDKSREDS
ncbi:spore germination protein [Metabacillus fastidiosus]|uniref:spore germination protein n=1 Tax=Metabacillus fastidiosus TaxID=1458 RepID=UPI002DB5F339|nr:spore germination protein [Metabacillus fastidiosus]MEC2078371.1 spore germination protein [Metabacillus fastidiosus]